MEPLSAWKAAVIATAITAAFIVVLVGLYAAPQYVIPALGIVVVWGSMFFMLQLSAPTFLSPPMPPPPPQPPTLGR